ncbi:L-rhamnose mutarotase [Melissococcus plutonius]|uniref:L-rhamnose mutarotase n=1 Tax=Melissococcus plutonius TaxID=33970 RepID=UPI00065E69A2|nr:L-rhamnose mutarotase [Melissococcus plutonius]KMT41157.1 L-rhamnose mutarotase RhaM [Melissococcus plutonius]
MIKKAIRMKLYPECKEVYIQRHQQLWPEMRQMLKEKGILSYLIFLDSETNYLFGYLEIEDEKKWEEISSTKINQKWWRFMEEIMETNPDHSPITQHLEMVFDL